MREVRIGCYPERTAAYWKKKVVGDEVTNEENGLFSLAARVCDSFSLLLLKEEVRCTKLAVKAATEDPSHKRPSHISPVI